MDFTIKSYELLIKSLVECGYEFITVNDYLQTKESRFIMLRHDVEARYENAFEFAKIQYRYGIRGTYYFRILKDHFKPEVVKEILLLGHEAGYHYDDLTICNGNFEKAILRFEKHLNLLNEIAPIKTICMDGSPLSKYDNKSLWEKYNYKDYNILSEPYFDIDFNTIFYLTDTGRMWDGEKFSVRDKVSTPIKDLKFHTTKDIINAANSGKLPNKLMLTFHPQRWNDKPIPWLKEMFMQNLKNQAKRFLISRRNNNVDY